MSAISKPIAVSRQLRWWQKYRNQSLIVSLLFVLPALINFAVFRYYPMLWAALVMASTAAFIGSRSMFTTRS